MLLASQQKVLKHTASSGFIPARGDLVWLEFNPPAGHEQQRHRPAISVSQK